MKRILSSRLSGSEWGSDKEKLKIWCREIVEEVKKRMVEIEPKGYKYSVTAQVSENCGQGSRADLACHWDSEYDCIAQEMFINDSVICTLLAFVIRIQY